MSYMEYRDRAIEALQAAQGKLRKDFETIILEAVKAEAFAEVALIARIAAAVSNVLAQVKAATDEAAPPPSPLAGQLLGADWPDSVRATAEEHVTMLQKLHPRRSSRRDQYPRFLRDGERLVKLAWSKKERAPYEHRAPREVIQTLVNAVQKKKGEGKLFQAADVMPLKNAVHEEFPSYQSYLALNWLRDVGIVRRKGREGYVLTPNAVTTEKLERLWMALPDYAVERVIESS
jgi:hypothetical protein